MRCVQNLWERGIGGEWRRLSLGLYGSLVLFMLATSFGPASFYSPRSLRSLGFGYAPEHPFEEVAYIQRREFEGVIYNEYRDGGLIIYALYPAIRPVMDPRIDIYGADLYREWLRSKTARWRFERYLKKYDVGLVLLWTQPENRQLLELLRRDRAWRLEKRFPNRALFRRQAKPVHGR